MKKPVFTGEVSRCRHCGNPVTKGKRSEKWRELLVVKKTLEALYQCESEASYGGRHEPY